jgi:phosphate transport system permease protein
MNRLRDGDEIARMITFLFAASVVLVTVLLIFELWQGSVLPRHKFGLHFFVTQVWDPIAEQFGALPFIYGTLVTAMVALLIAVPLGIGAAIFLAEWRRHDCRMRWNSLSIYWPPCRALSMDCWASLLWCH